MIKHIRLRTCVIFYVLFIASFIIPLPVRAKIRGINIVPAAILDLYSVVLDDFRHLDSQKQLHIIMSFLVFLIAHINGLRCGHRYPYSLVGSSQLWRASSSQTTEKLGGTGRPAKLISSIDNEPSDLYNADISGAEYIMFTQRPGARYD